MSDDPRDTQFAGFAKLLYDEIDPLFRDLAQERIHEVFETASGTVESIKQQIARRAYDLACHVSGATILTAHGDMGKIPDMTVWPEEDKG